MGTQMGVKELVQFIAEECERQNLSGRELAIRAGMNPNTTNRMFRGLDIPSTETLAKIANALGYGIVPFLMLAVKSHTGFDDVQLLETFQGLSARDRKTVLMLARQLSEPDRRQS